MRNSSAPALRVMTITRRYPRRPERWVRGSDAAPWSRWSRQEATALRAWDGHGAIRLLAASDDASRLSANDAPNDRDDDLEQSGRGQEILVRQDPEMRRWPCVTRLLNACVGQFGTATITASSKAITSTSPADIRYQITETEFAQLGANRDALATQILTLLENAEFNNSSPNEAQILSLTIQAQILTNLAQQLAAAS